MNEQERKYIVMLELALMDLMDGQAWDNIQDATGLPTERCYELEDLASNLFEKHGLIDENK